jgi:uncharacterized protein (DUF433 family)
MAMPAQTTPTEFAHIVCTPGVLGGEPRVDGHRIRVRDVAAARDMDGCSPEEIIRSVFPSLTLAEVYAALAYYEDHRPEIQAHAAAEARGLERFSTEHPGRVVDLRAPDASA